MRVILTTLIVLCGLTTARADEALPAKVFSVPDGLEVTVWAKAPMFYNPTNIDIDQHGRVWVAEAVNYRTFKDGREQTLKHPEGDRIMVLEDTDGDGAADKSWVFVQDKDLHAPLGVAVFGNRVVVSCSPSIIVYTDVDGDAKFNPDIDNKEVLLTGFGGFDHDHGLHSVVGGPDGRWYFNAGNAGPHIVTDKSGWTLRAGSFYTGGTPYNKDNTPGLKSDDGRVYVGGLAMSVKPDGTDLRVEAHNMRNCYEIAVNSFGDMFGTDNDDQVVSCRTTWMMRHANMGYASADGARSWHADRRPGESIPEAHWHQNDPGVIPFGDLYGAGSPTGICVYENGALPEKYNGIVLACEAGRNVVFGYHVKPDGVGYKLERFSFLASTADNPDYKWDQREQDPRKWFRPSDVCVGADGCIYVADWFDPVVGGHQMDDKVGGGAIYRIKPKGKNPKTPKLDLSTVEGQIEALKSPAVNVRWLAMESLRPSEFKAWTAPLVAMESESQPNSFFRARATQARAFLWSRNEDAKRQIAPFARDQFHTTGLLQLDMLIRSPDVPDRDYAIAALCLRLAFQELIDAGRDESVALNAGSLIDWLDTAHGPVLREISLALHGVAGSQVIDDLRVELATRYNGTDRFYLEAWGIGCEGKEDALYPVLLAKLGAPTLEWSDKFADLVWRIHPDAAATPVFERAMAGDVLSHDQRKQAIDTLAFMTSKRAAEAMAEVATKGPGDLRSYAAWWVKHRSGNTWREHGVGGAATGIAAKPQAVGGIVLPEEAAWSSDVVRKGDVVSIDVNITKAKHIYLVVDDAGDGNSCEWADWIEPRLVGPDGEVKLSDLKWTQAISGWGEARVGLNAGGGPLRVVGRDVADGLGVHSKSVLVYDIQNKGYTRLVARGGLDDGYDAAGKVAGGAQHPSCGKTASVTFAVYHDGPSPKRQVNVLKGVIKSAETSLAEKRHAVLELARTSWGGATLVHMASRDELSDELRDLAAEHIHANPDLSVRAMAGQYFPRKTATGQALPPIAELAKLSGDASRGKALFAGKAACATCHTHGEVGKAIGPDLTAIAAKFDRTALLDAMINPSAAIVFGYEAELVTTKSGNAVTGFIVGTGETLIVKDLAGQQHAIDKADIVARKKLDVSIMPSVATLGLSEQEIADLVEFMLNAPKKN